MHVSDNRGSHGDQDIARSFFASSVIGRIAGILVSLFLAFCTAAGTIYRQPGGSISWFGPAQWVCLIAVFLVYEAVLLIATACVRGHCSPLALIRAGRRGTATTADRRARAHHPAQSWPRWGAWVARRTRDFRRLWVFYLLALAWVPLLLTLLCGADLINQGTEVNNWLCARVLHGSGCTLTAMSYPPADIYPISHYLWPSAEATFLTNQHNLFLTLLVGLVRFASMRLTGMVWPADIVLVGLSYAFATFALAAMGSRLVRLHPSMGTTARSVLLLLPVLSPIVSLDTVALTKSPQFAFAFAWWASTLVLMVKKPQSVTRRDETALAFSTLACVLCVKYALALVLIELLVLLFARHRQWKRWLACLLLPAALFSGALHAVYATGQAIDGDPIESRSVLVQQIARIEKYDPTALDRSITRDLDPIFNLQQMAEVYNQNDADPVKSSGEGGTISYRWQDVTPAQWSGFMRAWSKAVKASPRVAFDAFVAEFYGYFDLADPPYVSFLYYADSFAVKADLGSAWAQNPVRTGIIRFFKGWAAIPVLGWPLHGNFWVVLTLLAVCVQLRLRRWTDFWLAVPLLAQMGVMVFAPANNFDRHTIALAVYAVFLLLDLVLTPSSPATLTTAGSAAKPLPAPKPSSSAVRSSLTPDPAPAASTDPAAAASADPAPARYCADQRSASASQARGSAHGSAADCRSRARRAGTAPAGSI